MTTAYLNRIATAVPPHDVHEAFLKFGLHALRDDRRGSILFRRMADKGGIEHRYSYVDVLDDPQDVLDRTGLYARGAFANTAVRMRFFEERAPLLAEQAVERLDLGPDRARITHLFIVCCTGLSSPGLDVEVIDRCGIPSTAERTVLGFMGCHASINALRLARHVVRSDAAARVLILSLELTTLHLKDTPEVERIVDFLLWGDGAAAAIVSADEEGFALDSFHPLLAADTRALITWTVRQAGFDMLLSSRVPAAIQLTIRDNVDTILEGASPAAIDLWAVHPGGRSVVDGIEKTLQLHPAALAASRDVLRRYGNMSSATVMFVLAAQMAQAKPGQRGCAMSFGPGLAAETMLFHAAG